MLLKNNCFICRLMGVCFAFVGIGAGAWLAFRGVIQGHIHISNGIAYIDNYQSLGIDMGLMGCLIGLVSAFFGIVVHKLKCLSLKFEDY